MKILACLLSVCFAVSAWGDDFSEVPVSRLSQQDLSLQGQRALAIRPQEWKHAETPHFILHFFRSFIAAPVSVEAEFYDRYIKADLGLENAGSSAPKTHLYLFETRADWFLFCQSVLLEPWTGAAQMGNSLFVPRYPELRWKGNSLGHEIAHLIVHRAFGPQVPLWLDEGYAEDVSDRGYKTFYRARGFAATPQEQRSPAWIPLARLTGFKRYPEPAEVTPFYRQSRSLTAYLIREGGKESFLKFFKASAQGTPFPAALGQGFGSRWSSPEALETSFKNRRDD